MKLNIAYYECLKFGKELLAIIKAFGSTFEGFSKPSIYVWHVPDINTTYLTGFADDNTPFVVRDNIADVIKILEEIGENLVNWFSNNEMNLNTYKYHLLLNSQEPNALKIGDLDINNSLSEKLLGITFGCKLKFIKNNEAICQKASQKLNALARLPPYMETTKNRILKNAFFNLQFN